MSDIFLSYSHDDKARARQVVVALSDCGWSVWWDQGIPIGRDFSKVVKDELYAARCVIVLWSQAAAQSNWVPGEADEALRRRLLFPVRLDAATVPIDWSRIQHADLSNWSGDITEPSFVHLRESVGAFLGAASDAGARSGGWLEGMPHLAAGLPLTRQVFGYSGRWTVKSVFSRWRGRNARLEEGESVIFNGTAYLGLQSNGKTGSGLQIGVLSARLLGGYMETRYIANEIMSASADEQLGTLALTIRVKHRSLAGPLVGDPPPDLGEDMLENLSLAIPFLVELNPVERKPRYLEGAHVYDPTALPYQVAKEYWTYLDL